MNNIISIFPIQNDELYDAYLAAQSCFWILKEIDYSNDKNDWNDKLNDNERMFLSNILSFFATSDQIVNINLEERFLDDIKQLPKDMIKYTELFYNFQKMIEDVHTQTYEFMLIEYLNDKKTINYYQNGINNIPAIKQKAEWAFKWINDEYSSFTTRLIAFAALEGIFFSSSFCAIYWIKEKNIMQGLTKSNEFISRDEGMHRDFACMLYKQLKNRSDYDFQTKDEVVYQIIDEAVKIEQKFIMDSISCDLIGMNSKHMKIYIEFVADNLLQTLGLQKKYNVKNPFDFMENISLVQKNNFFENRTTTYAKANSQKIEDTEFIISDDF